jgi:uncharacterized protein YndB with AHSA1/START domain
MPDQPIFELAIERHFNAPPVRVWERMTGKLAEWWSPRPWTTEVTAIEWRAGGPFNMIVSGPGGEKIETIGVLLEVIEGRQITFTDAFASGWFPRPAFMVGQMTIDPDRDGTRYRALARHWDQTALDEHRQNGFEVGWGAAADQLEQLVED